MKAYPINLKITNRCCTVIGGGKVAERKVMALLDAGAKVTVVSPEVTIELQMLSKDGEIGWLARDYIAGDISGCFIAVCAADNPDVNHKAAEEARNVGALVNVVDAPEECDFTIPSYISRGDLLITVSTGGKSPALARRLREELEAWYGEEYGVYLDMLAGQRAIVKEKLPNSKEREKFWRNALDSKVLALFRQGKRKEAEAMIKNAISSIGTQS